MTMTDTTIKAMSDRELAAFVAQAQAEIAGREKRRKEETIAKIRALAGEAGIAVSIGGARGRRARVKGASAPASAKGADKPAAAT